MSEAHSEISGPKVFTVVKYQGGTQFRYTKFSLWAEDMWKHKVVERSEAADYQKQLPAEDSRTLDDLINEWMITGVVL